MVHGSSFSEQIAHIVKEYIAQVEVGVVGRIHQYVVTSPLQLILNDDLLLHAGADGKRDFTGLRGIVREQLAQACHEQVPRMGIVRGRELTDSVFFRGDKNSFPFTQQQSLIGFVVGNTWLAKILVAGSDLVVRQEDDVRTRWAKQIFDQTQDGWVVRAGDIGN